MAALSGVTSITLGNPSDYNPPTGGTAEGIRMEEVNDKYKHVEFKCVFGDASGTYPASGIVFSTTGIQAQKVPGTSVALSSKQSVLAQFGFRSELTAMIFDDQSDSDGYLYKFDAANYKLRIYAVGATGAALSEMATGTAPASGIVLYGIAKGR